MRKKTVRLVQFRTLLLACSLMFLTVADAKPKAPIWLENAAKAPNPAFEPEDRPEAIVLWNEAVYELSADGKKVTTVRYAIRILESSGRDRAKAQANYRDGSSAVTRIKAWSIDRKGEVYAFKKGDASDVSTVGYSLYSEKRAKIIDGKPKCQVGTVFGFEYVVEEKSIFTQYRWFFAGSIPVVHSHVELVVPDQWQVAETLFHGAPTAKRDGNRYLWKMEDLEEVKREPNAPSTSVERPFVMIDVVPPESSRVKFSNLKFETWEDLSDYSHRIQSPQMSHTPEIAEKAQELTLDANGLFEKVQAIGEYVKSLRYASINIDLANGGGYTPRPAEEVFRVGYGDCKDKANLLHSMLQAIGIRAYPVIVNARDNDAVYSAWPSPYYFDHCISAVEVDGTVDTPAVIEDKDLGRILFIDATSSITPIGELPFDEQGGLTVIAKQGFDRLVRLPQAPAEVNSTTRVITAELLPNGTILGRVKDMYRGKKADEERVLRSRTDEKEYKAAYERWISDKNSSAVVELRKAEDNSLTTRSFEVELEFGIPAYAKSMRNQLLIFKPTILARREAHPYVEAERIAPIRFTPSLIEEESSIFIPLDFVVEEMTDTINIETGFAHYQATLELIEDKLVYKRSLRFDDALVPAEDYPKVQEFYRSIIEADQMPVVLARRS